MAFTVWLHTPSVGEFRTVKPLLEKFPPDVKMVFSFSSPRAESFFKETLVGKKVYKLFPPLGFNVGRLLQKEKPEVFLLVESDRYPALLGAEVRRKFLINARLSERSFAFLRLFKFLFVPKLNTFERILCKDEEACEKFHSLGVKSDVLRPCGNLKVVLKPPEGTVNLSFPEGAKVFVAGSTHRGEEEQLLYAFRKIKSQFPETVLVLVPRHPSRAEEVFKLANRIFPKARTFLRSEVEGNFNGDILIVDTLGELLHFYRLSDVAFVGGSLVKVGGHNILEPAYFGKPTLYGPYIFKFRDLEKVLESLNLARPVKNSDDIFKAVAEIFKNPLPQSGSLKNISEKVLNCYLTELNRLV